MNQSITTANPRRRRRWFSYSLRSFILFVTLAAFGIAWVVRGREQSRREVQIVEELEANGLIVTVAVGGPFDAPHSWSQFPKEQSWWRTALTDLLGPRVKYVEVDHLTDVTLLSGLKDLEWINLEEIQVSDFSPLAGLRNLRGILLSGSFVSDLTPLTGLANLEDLTLHRTRVSDLSPIAGLSKLEELRLTFSPVVDLSPLAALENLQFLDLYGTEVSDLTPLAGLKNLHQLSIGGTQLTDLSPLEGLKSLKFLSIQGISCSEERLGELQQHLPGCKITR